jgi:ComF family protein
MFETLRRLVLPACCLGCGLAAAAPHRLGLCLPCRAQLTPYPEPACVVCGRQLDVAAPPAGYRCGRCRGAAFAAVSRVMAPWSYRDPLAKVLWNYKFRQLDYLAADLAAAVAASVDAAFAGERPTALSVVPVPLHWWRRFVRGYDQAALLARALAAELELPCVEVLRRRRATGRQSDLPRSARQRNVRRAFALADPSTARRALAGRTVLLVDDVITTGTTVAAAAHCLRGAGAVEIFGVAVARTPPPQGPGATLRREI